jgi:DNA replication licensing factor MCM5
MPPKGGDYHILSRFDMIFIVRDVRESERDRGIAKHVLGIHVGFTTSRKHVSEDNEESEFDLPTMKKYIAYCRSRCAPCLNPAARRC